MSTLHFGIDTYADIALICGVREVDYYAKALAAYSVANTKAFNDSYFNRQKPLFPEEAKPITAEEIKAAVLKHPGTKIGHKRFNDAVSAAYLFDYNATSNGGTDFLDIEAAKGLVKVLGALTQECHRSLLVFMEE